MSSGFSANKTLDLIVREIKEKVIGKQSFTLVYFQVGLNTRSLFLTVYHVGAFTEMLADYTQLKNT